MIHSSMKNLAKIGFLAFASIAFCSILVAKPVDNLAVVFENPSGPDQAPSLATAIFSTEYIAEETQERISVVVMPLSIGTVSEGFGTEVFKPPYRGVHL